MEKQRVDIELPIDILKWVAVQAAEKGKSRRKLLSDIIMAYWANNSVSQRTIVNPINTNDWTTKDKEAFVKLCEQNFKQLNKQHPTPPPIRNIKI